MLTVLCSSAVIAENKSREVSGSLVLTNQELEMEKMFQLKFVFSPKNNFSLAIWTGYLEDSVYLERLHQNSLKT